LVSVWKSQDSTTASMVPVNTVCVVLSTQSKFSPVCVVLSDHTE